MGRCFSCSCYRRYYNSVEQRRLIPVSPPMQVERGSSGTVSLVPVFLTGGMSRSFIEKEGMLLLSSFDYGINNRAGNFPGSMYAMVQSDFLHPSLPPKVSCFSWWVLV